VKVLIADDQPAVCTALQLLFDLHGLPSVVVNRPEEALDLIATEDIGAVVQDMNFTQERTSGEEGVALFHAIKKLDPDLPVVLLTAWSSLETAVQLVKEGASDYMAKPWDDEKLARVVKNLVQMRALQQENTRLLAQRSRLRRTLAARYDLKGLVYVSDAMHSVVSLACTIAGSDAAVLISGPNGSGKERLAEIVQANSRRKDKPFVKVNAGALPDDLLEAELFGAEAGAFTGANKARIGRFEAAHGGTLFLDEIGNLSMAGQAKLLRVLQTGEFERLGSSGTRKVDVRIISATNTDLPRAIATGAFREDLYFRLNVIELPLPALGERPDDVLLLTDHFLATLPGIDGAPTARLSDEARATLTQYDWPGNVRELQNRIHRAKLTAVDGVIRAQHLGIPIGGARLRADGDLRGAVTPTPALGLPTLAGRDTPAPHLGDPERANIEQALVAAGGVVSKAAAEMGLSRQALYRRMERLGIVLERRPR
jgi:DNA-binding NtrC family response regulator